MTAWFSLRSLALSLAAGLGLWVSGLPLGVAPTWAQDGTPSALEHFRAGERAFEAERYAEAIEHFRVAATRESPGVLSPTDGSAWWWLGRAHRARGDSTDAHAAWRAGVNALHATDTLAVQLTDAYLRSVAEKNRAREWETATDLFLRLMGHAETELPPRAGRVLERRVAQTLPLLPDSLRVKVAPDPEAFRRNGGSPTPGAGEWLTTWWRRQDPRPSTAVNERIVEHLRRVVVARRRWGEEHRTAGYDARGRIFVRLGLPSTITHLESESVQNAHLASSMNQGNVDVSGNRFGGRIETMSLNAPDNEFWSYDSLEGSAHYVFVKGHQGYEIATVPDLLPDQLQRGFGPNDRYSAVVALRALRDYYGQLAQYHSGYASMVSDIDKYLGKLGNPFTVVKEPGFVSPTTSADREIGEGSAVGDRHARTRQNEVPDTRTEAVDTSLPLATRTARFLTEQGSTRTEVYVGIDSSALVPPAGHRLRLRQRGISDPDRYRLRLTTVRYGPDYASRRAAPAAQRIDAPPQEPVSYSLQLPNARGRYHLAVECAQYALEDSVSSFVRSGVHRIDSLRALPSDPGTLVLSDPVPLRARRLLEVDRVRDEKGFAIAPYPYDHVTPEMELALYVEAYHLNYGPDDRTRYSVAYEVERQTEKDGIAGWFGGTDEKVTTQSSTYEGTSRTAQEWVAFRLSRYNEASRLRISVRVTDEVSGQRAERTVTFEVE